MDKNWLIRTKSNHILGPISKEKVLELYKNGSIKPDDELASGNGFWFFVRETDMVEKYLTGEETQGFNPISEAKNVLTGSDVPAKDDADDITLIGAIDLSGLHGGLPPSPHTLVEPAAAPEEVPLTLEPKKKNSQRTKLKVLPPPSAKKPLKKQTYLKYLGYMGFILLVLLVYFRKTIIRSLFPGEVTLALPSLLFNDAHAQEDVPGKKKSS